MIYFILRHLSDVNQKQFLTYIHPKLTEKKSSSMCFLVYSLQNNESPFTSHFLADVFCSEVDDVDSPQNPFRRLRLCTA